MKNVPEFSMLGSVNKLKMTLLLMIVSIVASFQPVMAAEVVRVYSSRIEKLIKPSFDAFTRKTGIKVQYTTAKEAALLERLKAEKKYTKADLLLTVDAGNLWLAQEQGLLSTVNSGVLKKNVPEHLREKDGHWFGLTLRARTIVYSKERVKASELSTYEDLGNKKWEGKLCLRTSKKVYNKSLIASSIQSIGKKETEKLVGNWMANKPVIYPKDSTVLKAIVAGKCDVSLVNTYYLGRELKKNSDFPVGLIWANQNDRGTHVNITGAGVTRYSKNRENAIKLLEFLSSKEAQNLYADTNMEYPVNPDVPASREIVKWWGKEFKMDSTNIAMAGKLQKQATLLMDRAGYK